MAIPVLKAKISGIQGLKGPSNLITVEEFLFESTDGQDTIRLPQDSKYFVGTNSLFIFVNGKALSKNQYIETNNTTITLITPFPAGLEVFVKYIKYVENSDVGTVVVSNTFPVSKLREGVLWFNPNDRTFSVYSSNDGFKELLYKEDFEALVDEKIQNSGLLSNIDGGFF